MKSLSLFGVVVSFGLLYSLPCSADSTSPDNAALSTAAKKAVENLLSSQAALDKAVLEAQSAINKLNDAIQAAAKAPDTAKAAAAVVIPTAAAVTASGISYEQLLKGYSDMCSDPDLPSQKLAISQLGLLVQATDQPGYKPLDDVRQGATLKLLQMCTSSQKDLSFSAVDALFGAKATAGPILAKWLSPVPTDAPKYDPKLPRIDFSIPVQNGAAIVVTINDDAVVSKLLTTLSQGMLNSTNGLAVKPEEFIAILEFHARAKLTTATNVKNTAVANLADLSKNLTLVSKDFDPIVDLISGFAVGARSSDFYIVLLELLAVQKNLPSSPDKLSQAYLVLLAPPPAGPPAKTPQLKSTVLKALASLQSVLPGAPVATPAKAN